MVSQLVVEVTNGTCATCAAVSLAAFGLAIMARGFVRLLFRLKVRLVCVHVAHGMLLLIMLGFKCGWI